MPGLPVTFQRLAATENEAAVPVLISALDAAQRDVRDLALAALLCRKSATAELHLLRRWDELSLRWKQQIADRVGWLSDAIRTALVNREPKLFASGSAAAVFTREYEAIPLLVGAAGDRTTPVAAQAAATVLELAELLAEELAGPRDYRVRRDPQLVRNHVLTSLERAVADAARPPCREILEAFLLLASRDNAVLQRLLRAPADRTFPLLIEILHASSRPGIERLLLSYLDDPHAPLSALQTIGRRGDVSFLRHLTRKIGSDPPAVVRANLRRIEAIPWIGSNLGVLDALREAEQPGAVHLAVGSSIPRPEAAAVAAYIARHGKVHGRRVAARAAAEFDAPGMAQLTLDLLEDEDTLVRAAAAGQLRRRNIPGAIQRLLSLLGSPHAEERETAQAELAEFRLEAFAARFDDLSQEARVASGAIVRQVDPDAVVRLGHELAAPGRGRRRRALELAVALGAVGELVPMIAELLKDDDPYLRIDAIRTLATHDSPSTRQAIRDALVDPQPLVHEAAEQALARLGCGETALAARERDRDTVPLAGIAAARVAAGSPAGPMSAMTPGG
jgi:hypothetical protein